MNFLNVGQTLPVGKDVGTVQFVGFLKQVLLPLFYVFVYFLNILNEALDLISRLNCLQLCLIVGVHQLKLDLALASGYVSLAVLFELGYLSCLVRLGLLLF